VFAVVMVTIAAMTVKALRLEQWSAGAIIAAVLAAFAYQIGNYFRRNLPARYRPEMIPRDVLPKI
jgi:hypothetical protein